MDTRTADRQTESHSPRHQQGQYRVESKRHRQQEETLVHWFLVRMIAERWDCSSPVRRLQLLSISLRMCVHCCV